MFHVYGMLVYFEKNFKIEIKKENIDILSTLLKITSKQNGVIYGVRKSFIIMLEMLKDNMKRL